MRLITVLSAIIFASVICATASAQNIEFVNAIHIAGTHDIKVADTLVYMACMNSLVIFDISDPKSPVFIRQYFTPDYIYDLDIFGNYAYLANDSIGVQIIDISDPFAATSEGVIRTEGHALGIFVCDRLAYVVDGIALQIIDVSSPSDPKLVGSYKTPRHNWDVCVSDGYAYVANKYSGLQIINVSNPYSPRLAASYRPPDAVWDVRVHDHYAYLANGRTGLQIVDVINPAEPKLVGSYDTPDDAFGVCYSDGIVYVGDDSSFQIIDVSIPSAPLWKGSYDTRGIATHPYIANGYCYLTNYFTMTIFQIKPDGSEDSTEDTEVLPDEFALYQNYPNPFNSTTVIRYELPFQAKVTIVIYDVQGRKVATLIDRQQQAGNHTVLWNAEGISSGVYFYKMQAGDYSETKQMMLLK